MSKAKALGGSSLVALLTMGLWTGAGVTAALAQDEAANTEPEIVVTGSLIRGTPETAALPVDVITAEELMNRGSPTTLELIKSLPASNGVLGDTNQFDARAQGSSGSGSVNLRGLGPQRTLVLINGRRMAINPLVLAGAGAVDTNILPTAAIGRVEVLKEGAAATYGSDAIGGVVNFITRRDFDGVEFSGNYEHIEGSDGDYSVAGVFGWEGERANVLLTAGWQHRSELSTLDRDWAIQPYLNSPQGGWSAAGMPASFIPLGPPAAAALNRARDPGCAGVDNAFQGVTGAPPSVTPFCGWQYTQFDNITELEDRYQVYGQFDLELTDAIDFHAEALWAYTEQPEWKTSPSYALLQGPTSTTSPVPGQYFIPANNPGLIDFIADYTATGVPGVVASTGADSVIPASSFGGGALFIAGRMFGFGGNPLFNFGAAEAVYSYDALRLSSGLTGEFDNGVGWDLAVTYGEEVGYRSGRDTVVNRFQRALRGLGGPNCPLVGGTPGVGPCMFFNPFASGVPGNTITGVANPGYQPGLASNENPELIDWLMPEQWYEATSTLFTADLVLSGETGISFGGDAVAWALGAQYRETGFRNEVSDINNLGINPCIDSIDFNIHTCAAQTGPTGFLGGFLEQDLKQEVQAVFGELSVPVGEALEIQLAARYEDYGGATGSTFDPKISARLQVVDWLALRGTAQSTFRGPPLPQLQSGSVTALQEVRGTFRAIDIFGNPNLEPETANTYSAGAIVEAGGFTFTADYWRFEFENPINPDPLGAMVDMIFPTQPLPDWMPPLLQGQTNRCLDPAFAPLLSRFTFSAAGCGLANITRVRTNTVNGTPIETDGVDVSMQYRFDDALGGYLTFGGDATYVFRYEVDAAVVEGIQISAPFDGVGKLNYQTQIYSLPQWKGNAFIEWGNDTHTLRLMANYVDSYADQRTAPFAPALSTNGTAITAGMEIDSYLSFDANYRLDIANTTLTLGVNNITDEDPSFARLDLNYDPFTGDPIGRTIRVGLRQRF